MASTFVRTPIHQEVICINQIVSQEVTLAYPDLSNLKLYIPLWLSACGSQSPNMDHH